MKILKYLCYKNNYWIKLNSANSKHVVFLYFTTTTDDFISNWRNLINRNSSVYLFAYYYIVLIYILWMTKMIRYIHVQSFNIIIFQTVALSFWIHFCKFVLWLSLSRYFALFALKDLYAIWFTVFLSTNVPGEDYSRKKGQFYRRYSNYGRFTLIIWLRAFGLLAPQAI
jgi:hypothetical protein